LLGCTLAILGGVLYAEARRRAEELPIVKHANEQASEEAKSLVPHNQRTYEDDEDEDEPEWGEQR
jgi:hypothetical protein